MTRCPALTGVHGDCSKAVASSPKSSGKAVWGKRSNPCLRWVRLSWEQVMNYDGFFGFISGQPLDLPDSLPRRFTSPLVVYALGWMTARRERLADFDPLYTV